MKLSLDGIFHKSVTSHNDYIHVSFYLAIVSLAVSLHVQTRV